MLHKTLHKNVRLLWITKKENQKITDIEKDPISKKKKKWPINSIISQ